MSQEAFVAHHLEQVSRSFAFCIARLKPPFKDWVGVTYLLCRVLDTIEDAPWQSLSHQRQAYSTFLEWSGRGVEPSELDNFIQIFPAEITLGERHLIEESNQLFEIYHHFPESVKGVIHRLLESMAGGMRHFSESAQTQKFRLSSLSEVNSYCFFVAGVVGEALAQLTKLRDSSLRLEVKDFENAHHFGQFLQKVNILKDQFEDEEQGRFLVPQWQSLFDSVAEHSKKALEYIESLPIQMKDYRLFCAWSYCLGLASLQYIQKSYENKKFIKIPRSKALWVIAQVELYITNPDKFHDFCSDLESKLGFGRKVSSSQQQLDAVASELPDWLIKNYYGQLRSESLVKLRLGVV